jgi:hypothetical protein
MNLPVDPASERRTVPRHLRDTEHQGAPDTQGSGMRRADFPGRQRLRGLLLLGIAAAALAAGLWFGTGAPLGLACLCVAVAAGVLASLSFRRR